VAELFTNTVCDPPGSGQGEQFLASLTVTTDASGMAAFTVTVAVAVEPSRYVTATATDPASNTSEFSACVVVTGSGSPVLARPAPDHFTSGDFRPRPEVLADLWISPQQPWAPAWFTGLWLKHEGLGEVDNQGFDLLSDDQRQV
jgi:hypothetical protein